MVHTHKNASGEKQMYHTLDREGDAGDANDPLIVAARAEIAARGLQGASMRNIAAAAGVSPATVNHRYGGKNALAEAALRNAIAEEREFLAGVAAQIARAAAMGAAPAAALDLAATVMFGERREPPLLRWACLNQTERDGGFEDASRAWIDLIEDFWTGVANMLGLPEKSAWLIGGAIESFSRAIYMTSQPVLLAGWRRDFCERLVQRVSGTGSAGVKDSSWRLAFAKSAKAARATPPALNEKQRAIIETAARIIQREGPDALTHRAIAKAANVSLSSTTHYFTSLREIFHLAYQAIIDGSVSAAGKGSIFREKKYSREKFAEDMASSVMSQPRKVRASLQEIDLLAASDPEMRPMADALIARFGETTHKMLSGLQDAPADLDVLDCVIWRSFLISAFQAAMTKSKGRRSAWLRDAILDALKATFPHRPAERPSGRKAH